MSIKEYISILDYSDVGINIGVRANLALGYFITEQQMSIYNVYTKLLNDPPTKSSYRNEYMLSYKNTHKRIKRLESLEFLKRVKVKDSMHGAKYYRLTEAGAFQLFLQHQDLSFISNLPLVFKINGNYSIFETLLYPCLKKEALITFSHLSERKTNQNLFHKHFFFKIFYSIYQYLRFCCIEIYDFLAETRHGLDINALIARLLLLKDGLLLDILTYFRSCKKSTELAALAVLTQGEKFMERAIDLEKDLKRSLDFAIRLRK